VATLMKMVAPIMATYVGTAPKLTLPKNTSKQSWNRRLTGCCCSRTNKRTHRTETLAEFCAPTSIFTILLDALPYALQQNNVPALAESVSKMSAVLELKLSQELLVSGDSADWE